MQLGWTYTELNRFSRGLYIRETLIGVQTSNTGGYKLFQVFGPYSGDNHKKLVDLHEFRRHRHERNRPEILAFNIA